MLYEVKIKQYFDHMSSISRQNQPQIYHGLSSLNVVHNDLINCLFTFTWTPVIAAGNLKLFKTVAVYIASYYGLTK